MFENPNIQTEKKEAEKKLAFESAAFNIPKEGHPISEDSILVDDDHMLFGVFDGIGGHAAGEIASKIAVSKMKSSADQVSIPNGKIAASPNEVAEQLSSKLIFADAEIYKEAESDPAKRKMGTTASVVKLFASPENKKFAVIANAGDSRVYILANGKIKKVTRDDHALRSLGIPEEDLGHFEEKLDNAKSTDDLQDIEIAAFRARNAISNYLGRHDGATIKIYIAELAGGERIIITSDGIHDNLTTTEIEKVAKKDMTAKDIATALVKNAKDRSEELDPETGERHLRAKRDDMSAVVIEIEPKPGRTSIEDEITQKIKISR
jgi:protein phosphatase